MHNGHAARNIHVLKGFIQDSLVKQSKNVRSRLFDTFGSQIKTLGSTYYTGSFCGWNYKPQEIPIPSKESLEKQLHDAGYQWAFIHSLRSKLFYTYFNEFNN